MLALVIDDNEDLAVMVVEALRLEGVEARAWTTGFDVLLGDDPWRGVDVAVVDLNLPGVEGEDILRGLRDRHPGIRRVLYSGTDVQWLPAGLALAGMCHSVVLKSADLRELMEAIRG